VKAPRRKIIFTNMLANMMAGGHWLVLPYTVVELAPGVDYYPVAAFSTLHEARLYNRKLREQERNA
jgi:hypothetical protein